VNERFSSEDEATAYNVYQRLRKFVNRFEERTTASGALEAILHGDEFLGGYVNQKPELFTEQQLIGPVLDALGYREVRGGDRTNSLRTNGTGLIFRYSIRRHRWSASLSRSGSD
jgi:hypothetical protein